MPHAEEPTLSLFEPACRLMGLGALLALGATFGRTPLGAASAEGAVRVGDEVCATCHREKVHSFHETAHFRTSSLPSAESVDGPFAPGSNVLLSLNPNLSFTMEASDKGFFETAHMKTSQTEELTRSERIDVVVGSGRKGQTYLYWDGDQLFQLPISYWTQLHGWVNSPGYIDGTADFDRQIVPRCLECHSSSFENRPPPENRYNTESLILGVTCEKCHGPGSEHVARFRRTPAPASTENYAIVNPARLSRSRQLQLCGLCHEGGGTALQPALSYRPGDDLGEFIAFAKLAPNARVDVHASQVQLLERSRCFRSTRTLTCTTCHDVHATERDTAPFSAKCLACHKVDNCGEFAKRGHAIDALCVDCHMPLQETAKIVSRVDGETVRPKVRNHHIAIYPDVAAP